MGGNKWALGLTIAGVAGVGLTSWLSVKCSKKAEQETETKKKVLAYAPAIASGVITCGSIIASHRISAKEIVALTATCGYLAAYRDRIEDKVRDRFGGTALNEIRQETAIELSKEKKFPQIEEHHKRVSIEDSGHGNVHFVEYYLGREFYSSLEAVEKAEKELNYRFHNGQSVCMNDFYELLGIRKSRAGWEFGWPANDDYMDYNLETPIQFENILGEDEDGSLLYMIDIRTSPLDCWMEVS